MRLKRIFSSFYAKVTLSIALLALLLWRLDLRQLGAVFMEARFGWVVAAIGFYFLSQVLSAWRWQMLARPLGFTEPFSRFFLYYFNGMFLNLFVPSTVAGDVTRALSLSGTTRRRGLAVTSVIADRGIGFIALVWIAAIAIVLLTAYPLPPLLYWVGIAAPFASAGAWWWGPLFAVRRLPSRNRWRTLVERDLEPYRNDPTLLASSLALAAVFHFTQILTQIFVAQALSLDVAWPFFFVFVPMVNIAGMLPFSLSGVGVREACYWYFLHKVSIGKEPAIAYGLLSSAIVLLVGLTGALTLLMGLRRPRDD
jgi:uncharacterized membrane protein YbhN (UPF0104 family)